jgi:hypothetical protein
MTGRIIKYSEPIPFHKAMPGSKSIVIMKRVDNGIPEGFTPPKRKKIPQVSNAHNEPIDDKIGKPAEKGITMTDINRGPFHAMLDRQALALQAKTGESYASAFTKVYTDPSNRSIVDNARLNHLEMGEDAICGSRLSAIPIAKSAPSYDPLAKAADLAQHLGPAHAKLHSLAVDHMRAHAGQSYESAYSYLYGKPENVSLRNAVKAEHMKATMSGYADQGLGKAAPADEVQDDVTPGSADLELHSLAVARMKREPGLSYERAFTREYLHPDNRSLKDRVTAEGILRMQAMAPAKPFPAYGHPGDRTYTNPNVGREGRRPKGYAGG